MVRQVCAEGLRKAHVSDVVGRDLMPVIDLLSLLDFIVYLFHMKFFAFSQSHLIHLEDYGCLLDH